MWLRKAVCPWSPPRPLAAVETRLGVPGRKSRSWRHSDTGARDPWDLTLRHVAAHGVRQAGFCWEEFLCVLFTEGDVRSRWGGDPPPREHDGEICS